MRVASSDLRRDLDSLPADIDTIVFVGLGTEWLVPAMVERYSTADADALVAVRTVNEAVKRVHDGIVSTGLDRTGIVTVAGPEIVDRAALEAALSDPPDSIIDPAAAVAAYGGRVLPFPIRPRD